MNFRASLTKTQNERAAVATSTEGDETNEKGENEEKEEESGLKHTPSNLSPWIACTRALSLFKIHTCVIDSSSLCVHLLFGDK